MGVPSPQNHIGRFFEKHRKILLSDLYALCRGSKGVDKNCGRLFGEWGGLLGGCEKGGGGLLCHGRCQISWGLGGGPPRLSPHRFGALFYGNHCLRCLWLLDQGGISQDLLPPL